MRVAPPHSPTHPPRVAGLDPATHAATTNPAPPATEHPPQPAQRRRPNPSPQTKPPPSPSVPSVPPPRLLCFILPSQPKHPLNPINRQMFLYPRNARPHRPPPVRTSPKRTPQPPYPKYSITNSAVSAAPPVSTSKIPPSSRTNTPDRRGSSPATTHSIRIRRPTRTGPRNCTRYETPTRTPVSSLPNPRLVIPASSAEVCAPLAISSPYRLAAAAASS